MMSNDPRGLRNKNPGNIDRTNPRTPWQGAVPASQLTDSRFEQFRSAEWGIRALARVLITYQDKHNLNSVRAIIDRWAPPVENNTDAYIQAVARSIGTGTNQRIDVHDYAVMLPLVKAIIQHENGQQPYSAAQLNAGLRLAGVVPVKDEQIKPLMQTKTVAGAAVTGVAGLASVGEQVQEAGSMASMLTSPGSIFAIICGALIVIGVAVVIYGKWHSRQRGGV